MGSEITIKYLNENDIRFIIPKNHRVYTLKLHKEKQSQWVAMVGNIKSDDAEELIISLIEYVFRDKRAVSLLNKLRIPRDLPIVS